jgi:hypothetical protein
LGTEQVTVKVIAVFDAIALGVRDVTTTGHYRSILGVATTTGILHLRPLAASVILP